MIKCNYKFPHLLLLLLAFNINAQEFYRSIAMPTTTQGKKIAITPTGYMIVGECASADYKKKEVLVYNTNKNGEVLQANTYSGAESYAINDFRINTNGSVTLLAERYLKKRESLLMMNIDLNNQISSAIPYDENGAEVEPYSMAQTNKGDNLVVGFTKLSTPIQGGFFIANKEDQYFYILKTNEKGEKIWSKYIDFGTGTISSASSITKISANEYIVLAFYTKENFGENVIIKINDEGNILWSKHAASNIKGFQKVQLLKNNTIAIVGSQEIEKENTDICIINLDFNGKILWTNAYGGNSEDRVRGISSDKLGMVLTGVTKKDAIKGEQICILNVGYDGHLKWSNFYGTGTLEDVSNPVLDEDYIVFTGLTFGMSTGVKSTLCKIKNENKAERNLNFKTRSLHLTLSPFSLKFSKLNQSAFGGEYKVSDTKVNSVKLNNELIKF